MGENLCVTIYTDGSCLGNPGAGGWAVILKKRDGIKKISGGAARTTNNRMELTAAIRALQLMAADEIGVLYTDSTYVCMLGGGFISTMIKHSKMDTASSQIEAAKADLQNFSRELRDVQEYINVDLSTGDFWGFADWFFDGLFSDWMMQDRINDARRQVQQAIYRVEDVLRRLR